MVKDVLIEIENAGAEANEIPQVLNEEIKGLFPVEGYKCSEETCNFLTSLKCNFNGHGIQKHSSHNLVPTSVKFYKIKYGDNRILEDSNPIQTVSSGFLENMQEWRQMSQSHPETLEPRDLNYFDRNLGWTKYYEEVGYENCLKSVSVEECDLLSANICEEVIKFSQKYIGSSNQKITLLKSRYLPI